MEIVIVYYLEVLEIVFKKVLYVFKVLYICGCLKDILENL